MVISTQIQIVSPHMPLEATCRRPVDPDVDGLFAIDGFVEEVVDGHVVSLPYARQNWTQVTFYARWDDPYLPTSFVWADADDNGWVPIQRVSVIGVSTLADALAVLNDSSLQRSDEFLIPIDRTQRDGCGWFGWGHCQTVAVHAIVFIQEA